MSGLLSPSTSGDRCAQFRDAIAGAGLTPPDAIEADGELHRFASNGKHGDDAGWYVFHANGIAAGAFGDWRTGVTETWRANIGRKLTPSEAAELARTVAEAKAKREADEANRRAAARERAAATWRTATAASADHPYLRDKGVGPRGIRQSGDDLIVPMRDAMGELHSLQTIAPDGTKRFAPGGRAAGCYYSIGKPNDVICIAEGYATAASVHEATGHAVACAFDAGNLKSVSLALRAKLPTARIIVCADDDYRTSGNPGLTKATEAACAVGAVLAIPNFGDERPDGATDFNDLARHCGAEAVQRAVASARKPELPSHQPSAQNATPADLATEVAGFGPVAMLDLVNKQFPTPQALLGPWLNEQGIAQVHAWRGVGKTHFSLGVGYAVATGGKFLRWEAPRPQRVLFIDGEMPAVAIQERLRAIIEADDRDIDIDGAMLRFITPDLLDGAPPDLADPDDRLRLQRDIDEFDPKLIIVDNISTLVRSGGSENDAEAWIPVQAWALQMRRQGRSVLFVHHTGKGGKQRGTSKREDVLDMVIALQRPEPYDPADGARFVVEFEKARHVRGDDAKSFEAHLTHDARGRQTWTMRDIEASTMERVVRLWSDGITSVRELAEELGVHKSNVSRALKKARADGLIVDKGSA